MTWPNGETVVRLRGTPVPDPYSGDTALGWDAPAELPFDGVAVEPTTSAGTLSRPVESRHAVTSGYRLYLPAGADITGADRVRVRGEAHKVISEPAEWRSPFTGWEPGTVVTVERVEG